MLRSCRCRCHTVVPQRSQEASSQYSPGAESPGFVPCHALSLNRVACAATGTGGLDALDVKPTTPQGNASSTAPSGVPMLPQLPSPGHVSLPAATLSGAGGNTLCSASLMHQGSGLAHQGSFSSQQQMHAMTQVRIIR